MMLFILVPLALAVVNWLVLFHLEKGDTRRSLAVAEFISKPAVIASLLVWMAIFSGFRGELFWFGLALFFSLLGDIALLHSYKRKAVTLALVSFLLTHIFLIRGIIPAFPPRLNPVGYFVFAMVMFVSATLCRSMVRSPLLAGKTGSKIGVAIYIFTLGLMLTSALFAYTQGERWKEVPALLVGTGGLLFYVSDTLLGQRLFAAPFRHDRLYNRITYHLGQIAIALGAVLHYLPPA